MPRSERKACLEALREARDGHLVIAYITSTRPGFEMPMADDVLRQVFDHLEADRASAEKGVDLFIHSNGGQGTVPWRLVSLIREYTKNFSVMVPHRAFSAATLVALGANEIIMHRMGCLGPIDPSVANAFNPVSPQNPGQPVSISVEDVSAFFKLVKEEVGINHEEELVQTISALTNVVHPLALGNVQRSHSQSRMMATKLLHTHYAEDKEHEIAPIVENLKSNLFFHGHPINRCEAKHDLNLKVKDATEDLERIMWELFTHYETELKLNDRFELPREWESRQATPPTPPIPTVQDIVNSMIQLSQMGIGLGTVTPGQLVELADAIRRQIASSGTGSTEVRIPGILGVIVESVFRADVFKTDLLIDRITIANGGSPQRSYRCEPVWQRWEIEP